MPHSPAHPTTPHKAKKIVLPVFELTELTTPDDPEAVFVPLDAAPESALAGYHVRPKRIAETGERRDGRPSWVRFQFNLFPVVLDQTGAPWPEANIYILSRLENEVRVSMTTYSAITEGPSPEKTP